MVFVEPGRAEHGDAGGVEIEALEAAQELEEEADGALEVGLAAAPTLEEHLLGAFELAQQGGGLVENIAVHGEDLGNGSEHLLLFLGPIPAPAIRDCRSRGAHLARFRKSRSRWRGKIAAA